MPSQGAPFDSLDALLNSDPDPRRNEVVLVALSHLGAPYRWGGHSPAGFDCSGLVAYAYFQALRLQLPRTTIAQARAGRALPVDALRPADLVFYNTLNRSFSHVGLYLSEGRFVHAPSAGQTVRVDSMEGDYWSERFDGARRLIA